MQVEKKVENVMVPIRFSALLRKILRNKNFCAMTRFCVIGQKRCCSIVPLFSVYQWVAVRRSRLTDSQTDR